jgi:hypothetical protein
VQGAKAELAVALGALGLMGTFALLPPVGAFQSRAAVTVASVVLALVAWVRSGPSAAIAVVTAATTLGELFGLPSFLALPAAVGALALVARTRPELGVVRMPRGRVPVAATIACAAVTPVALFGWVALLRPDLHDLEALVPKAEPWLLLVGGAVFALWNALAEEWVWRGVIQSRLAAFTAVPIAIVLQAASFGVGHAHGFPRGAVGMLLAGVWAIMLGALRARAGGLLAPVLSHLVADATIAFVLVTRARL